MLTGDPNEALLGREAPHPCIFAQVEDGRRIPCHFDVYLPVKQLDSDYLIPRPSDGAVIVGGGEWNVPLEDQLGHTDDSITHPAITRHLRGVCAKNFEGWGDEARGEGLITDWTGIMGETPDCECGNRQRSRLTFNSCALRG